MADTGKTIALIKALAKVDPADIQESVEDWLDDHPEATTTVQDGSITKAKLDNNLQSTVDDVSDLKSAIEDIDAQINGGEILTPHAKQTSDFTMDGYYIDATTKKWASTSNNRGYHIDITGYAKISITKGTKNGQIAFLDSYNPEVGASANFAVGTNLIINDGTYEADVPPDAQYLYMRRIDSSGYNLDPSSITFYTTEHADDTIVGEIEALQTAVAGKQNTLTFDDVPTASSNNPVKSSGIKASIDTINNAVFETEDVSQLISESDLTMVGYYIDTTTKKWGYNSNNNRGYVISLDGYSKISVVSKTFTSQSTKTDIAFLKTYEPVTGELADFASWTSTIRIDSGDTYTADVPSDAHYLHIRRINGDGVNVTPQSITFYYKKYTQDSLAGKVESVESINNAVHIRISTYNVGDFTGTGLTPGDDETALAYRQAISKAGSEIMGTQADQQYFTGTTPPYDVLYEPMFKYHHPFGTSAFNCLDCLSDYAIKVSTDIQFTSYQYHPHYSHYVIDVQGIDVNVIVVHLDWYDITIRHNQISEIQTYISDLKHVIVLGDFNPANRTNGQYNDPDNLYMWDTDYALWTAEGYSIANCGALGEFDTCLSDQGGYWFPCDQIVVSDDIKIKAAGVVKETWHNDHIPFWADLCIYKVE